MDLQQYFSAAFYRTLFSSLFSGQQGRQVGIALAGVVGAVAVVVGSYLVYDQVAGVPVPNVKVAPAKEVAAFLGHPRGLARLPVDRRVEFMGKLVAAHAEPAKRDKLAGELRRMTSEEKKVCRNAMWDAGYSIFVKEVEAYHQTPAEARAEFVDRKIVELEEGRSYVRGNPRSQRPQRPLFDDSWMEGLPTDSDGMVKLMIAKTGPKDRARMKPYVEAMRARMDELKKDPREMERLRARYGSPASPGD